MAKKRTEDQKQKMREAAKRRWASSEERERQSRRITELGLTRSPEEREKNAAAHRGKKWTDDQRVKFVAAMSGENNPNFGKSPSEETRQKIREANTGRAAQLQKYGITEELYKSETERGNRWCFFKKHFAPKEQFKNAVGCCDECKPEHYRKSDLKKNYSLTQEWYAAKLAEQNGGCALCGKVGASKGDRYLAVDHNHTTGEARGVLCSQCNTALERFETVAGFGLKVLVYLEKYKSL